MTKTKKALMVAAMVAALGAGAAGVRTTLAAEDGAKRSNPLSDVVDALVEKFDLNRDEVQAVIDAELKEMKAGRPERAEFRMGGHGPRGFHQPMTEMPTDNT